jgi:iron complex outermembrane recepter protein
MFRFHPDAARCGNTSRVHPAAAPMRPVITLALFLATVGCVHAGTHLFTGVVLDSTNRAPLIGATVMITSGATQTGGFTDEKGRFHITVSDHGMHTVIARYIGYREKSFTVDITGEMTATILLAPMPVELGGIDVNANRDRMRERSSAQSVTVLTPAEIDQHRGQTLGETLEGVRGVSLIQTGPSIAKPVIRGLHSSRVLVLNAGVQQEGQQWGGEHAPEIDPFAAGKIEVLRGPSSIEYGAGALGGVIRVEPRPLRTMPGLAGSLSVNAFSNNRQGSGSFLIEGSPAFLPGFAVEAQGSYRRAGDASAPGYVIGNSGFEEINGSILAGYRAERVHADLYLSHFGSELGIYRGSHVGNYDDLMRAIALGRPPVEYAFSYDITPPKQDVTHDLATVRSSATFPEAGTLELQLGSQQNRRKEYDVHKRWYDTTSTATQAAFDLQLTTYDAAMRFRHVPLGNLVGSMGVSTARQTNVGNSLSFLIPNYRLHTAGAFITESLVLDAVTVQAGGRWDWSSLEVFSYAERGVPHATLVRSGFTGAVGMLFPFFEYWSLGANVSTAWRAPGVNELYSNGVHHGTAQYEIGDPALSGERSVNIDAVLRYATPEAEFEVSAYRNSMRGFISLFPDPRPTLTLSGLFPTFRYRQDDAIISGIDGSASVQVTEAFRSTISFSMLRGELSASGAPLYQMPSDRARLTEHLHLPDLGTLHESYVELTAVLVRRQDRFPAGIDYRDPPPGYALLNATIGTRLAVGSGDIQVLLSVNNVFDKAYRDAMSRFRYYVDEPGRSVILRANIPFTLIASEHI